MLYTIAFMEIADVSVAKYIIKPKIDLMLLLIITNCFVLILYTINTNIPISF